MISVDHLTMPLQVLQDEGDGASALPRAQRDVGRSVRHAADMNGEAAHDPTAHLIRYAIDKLLCDPVHSRSPSAEAREGEVGQKLSERSS